MACLMDVGAGGAYYLATAADQIVAHPDLRDRRHRRDSEPLQFARPDGPVQRGGQPTKAGKNIDVGTPIVALDPERRALLQAMADEFHDAVSVALSTKARPEVDANLETNFDGRVFTAHQAADRHLIDTVGYFDDAVARSRTMSGEPPSYDRLLPSHERSGPFALCCHAQRASAKHVDPLPSLPGLDRTRLPSFLYLWQPDPTLEKLGGR